MKLLKLIGMLSLLILLVSCAQPKYLKQNSAYIVWKTPTFRYADQGFIYESPEQIKLEIYGNGQPLMRLEISENKVCSSFISCMSKEAFNQKVLSAYYPKDLLENILRGKMIFHGSHAVKKRNGFTQNLRNDSKYEIHYSVLNNEIRFSDTINEIQLKVIKQ